MIIRDFMKHILRRNVVYTSNAFKYLKILDNYDRKRDHNYLSNRSLFESTITVEMLKNINPTLYRRIRENKYGPSEFECGVEHIFGNFPILKRITRINEAYGKTGFILILDKTDIDNISLKDYSKKKDYLVKKYFKHLKNFNRIIIFDDLPMKKDSEGWTSSLRLNLMFDGLNVCYVPKELFDSGIKHTGQEMLGLYNIYADYLIELSDIKYKQKNISNNKKKNIVKIVSILKKQDKTTVELSENLNMSTRNIQRYIEDANYMGYNIKYNASNKKWFY